MDTNLEALTISRLFDLSHTRAAGIFDGFAYPWEILDGLADFIRALGPTLPAEDFRRTGEDVWIARSAREMCIRDRPHRGRKNPLRRHL